LSFLLDTNVVSELAKTRPNSKVIAWLGSVPSTDLFLSVITLGEIRKGIEKKRAASPGDAARLEAWLTTLMLHYRSRVLPFDQDSADQWGRVMAVHPRGLSKMANSKLASLLSIRFDSPPSSLPKTVISPALARVDEVAAGTLAILHSAPFRE